MPLAPDNRPDPHRRITPGGFHSDSPFARQFQPPPPVDKTPKPDPVPNVVNPKDLEEAYHRLEEQILLLEDSPTERVARADGVSLVEELETIRNLIYRNLR